MLSEKQSGAAVRMGQKEKCNVGVILQQSAPGNQASAGRPFADSSAEA
jgi:hypothetical protein